MDREEDNESGNEEDDETGHEVYTDGDGSITLYLVHKAYGQYGQYVPHFYCMNCESYLEAIETAPRNCSSCKAELDTEKKPYFLEHFGTTKISFSGIVSDIQCGEEYQKIKQSGQKGHR